MQEWPECHQNNNDNDTSLENLFNNPQEVLMRLTLSDYAKSISRIFYYSEKTWMSS